MKCYNCGARLSEHDFCTNCNADVRLYKKIIRTSNYFYNQGLEKAKVKQYDLVMSDKDMPRMTGLVLLDNLRRLEQYKEVPVVIVSADQSPDVLAEFERLGANAIIAKSDFERSKLISTIKSLLKD